MKPKKWEPEEVEEVDEVVAENLRSHALGVSLTRPTTCGLCGAVLWGEADEHFLDDGGCVNKPKGN